MASRRMAGSAPSSTAGGVRRPRAIRSGPGAAATETPASDACGAERNRISRFKRQHGPAPAGPDALIAAQQGVCRICPITPAEHVDHCHEAGRVRGVLCFSCDAALGQFKERPDAIRRAAAYVEGNAWKPTLVASGVYQLPS
ncbi:endonuclease VII domain-containing protein [Streptomyces sp. NPDC048142]|uniref:endonuclease VII domain-containing protein n=1 Tax=Streptomyces sp. NPDC048142 TaxID=3365501 RepID=UPI003718ED87